MKFRLFFITALFVLFFGQTAYADYIQGHVVQVDRETGIVEILLCDVCSGDSGCCHEKGHVEAHGDDAAHVRIIVSWIPRCLSEGMMIFARGVFAEKDATRFDAVEIFPSKRRGGQDSTGVRSRFRYHKGRGHHE